MRRAALVVLAIAVLAFATDAAAVPSSYVGQINNGSAGGNAWSYGYQVGGATIFALDPTAAFTYSYDDVNGNGLDSGDRVLVNARINIRDYSGDLLGSHTLGGSIGTLTLTGVFTVGGSTSGYFSNSLNGTLQYSAQFTGAPSHNLANGVGAGDTLSGTASVSGGILGYGGATPDLRFAFYGGGGAAYRNGLPGGENLGFGVSISGVPGGCDDFPNLPGCHQGVPAPASLALVGLGLVAAGIVARRRRR